MMSTNQLFFHFSVSLFPHLKTHCSAIAQWDLILSCGRRASSILKQQIKAISSTVLQCVETIPFSICLSFAITKYYENRILIMHSKEDREWEQRNTKLGEKQQLKFEYNFYTNDDVKCNKKDIHHLQYCQFSGFVKKWWHYIHHQNLRAWFPILSVMFNIPTIKTDQRKGIWFITLLHF